MKPQMTKGPINMKRKHENDTNGHAEPPPPKKRAISDETVKSYFRKGLFEEAVLNTYTEEYSRSKPYKHGVISGLLSPDLLRKVRGEIQSSLSFTPKETDIYKIHQSGDLANLDGLDDASLAQLPSLLTLRDSLYSSAFRKYLAHVAGTGPLSGQKTDMAINVYTPGCHLLCHDDVIGSRRISYILYLTDPDKPWKPEWGGALRLYPTTTSVEEDGSVTKTPSPDFTVSIPPAFNQLSFFAVQPGESFHDVEEVYAGKGDGEDDGGRIRMAISGWFHIPQPGEEGYVEGEEQKQAEKSSLAQLQGKADRFDFPKPHTTHYAPDVDGAANPTNGKDKQPAPADEDEENELTENGLNFLLKFLAPTYLTPDTLEELSELFADDSSLQLNNFLSKKFTSKLRTYITSQEATQLPTSTPAIEKETPWKVAKPPHKHRFLYQQQSTDKTEEQSTLQILLNDLLPSQPFKKWLALATGLRLDSYNVLARRFRRGRDYTLATSYDEETPRVEVTVNITPTPGWGGDDEEGTTEVNSASSNSIPASKNDKENGKDENKVDGVGGYELYMAGDDDQDEDAAVYKGGDDDDEGTLFSMPAGWNKVSIVLRDSGVLRFVKYVSQKAKGDRWDVCGEFGVIEEDDETEGENGKDFDEELDDEEEEDDEN